MKLVQGVLRSLAVGISPSCQGFSITRTLATSSASVIETDANTNSSETLEEFDRSIFGDIRDSSLTSRSFFQKLDQQKKALDRSAINSRLFGSWRPGSVDGLDESFTTLSDGMDGKLKDAASYFEYDVDEVNKDDYKFRSDVTFWSGNTYDAKDLDLTKPGVRKPSRRPEFEVTTEEVLQKADFRVSNFAAGIDIQLEDISTYSASALTLEDEEGGFCFLILEGGCGGFANVRFLANFITEAGVIIKRSKTKISAKAQRKVAREIKTARAFGLMPFTTMGTKHFVYGRTMQDLDKDYEYETYGHNFDHCSITPPPK
ncbi:Ribosomal protein S18 [Cynara cardunculus var. scolymus]|uniref:Small ribosomal subunit protein bS18c n=1 Tax=Cynara cardunculus var. scolymus TaxID=59895 RepID=A0A103XNH8_CYNCS|nr:Ribosomal protein S18 [Cynara cardunculus var. scolymus]